MRTCEPPSIRIFGYCPSEPHCARSVRDVLLRFRVEEGCCSPSVPYALPAVGSLHHRPGYFLKFPPARLSPGGPSEALWARFLGLAPALVCSGSTSVPDVPWVAQKLPVRPPHASRASPKAPGHPQDTPKDPQVAPNKQEQLPKKLFSIFFVAFRKERATKAQKDSKIDP